MSKDVGNRLVTLRAGASLSLVADEEPIHGTSPVAVVINGNWTAADVTFQVQARINEPFYSLFNPLGAEVIVPSASIPAGAISRRFQLNVADFLGVYAVRVRSGTEALPVAQVAGGDVTFNLITKNIS